MVRHYALVLYDHLGQAVIANLGWSLACLPWIVVSTMMVWGAAWLASAFQQSAIEAIGFVAAALFVWMSPPTLFLCALTHGWLGEEPSDWRAALALTRRLLWKAQAAGALITLVVTLLLANALFYQGWGGWVGLCLSGVMLWIIVGVGLVNHLLFPVLVANPQTGLLPAFRQCALLVLDNIGRCLALAAGAVAMLLVGAISGVGLVLGMTTALTFIGTLGLRQLMQRYGGDGIEPDRRSLRDLIRPWQT